MTEIQLQRYPPDFDGSEVDPGADVWVLGAANGPGAGSQTRWRPREISGCVCDNDADACDCDEANLLRSRICGLVAVGGDPRFLRNRLTQLLGWAARTESAWEIVARANALKGKRGGWPPEDESCPPPDVRVVRQYNLRCVILITYRKRVSRFGDSRPENKALGLRSRWCEPVITVLRCWRPDPGDPVPPEMGAEPHTSLPSPPPRDSGLMSVVKRGSCEPGGCGNGGVSGPTGGGSPPGGGGGRRGGGFAGGGASPGSGVGATDEPPELGGELAPQLPSGPIRDPSQVTSADPPPKKAVPPQQGPPEPPPEPPRFDTQQDLPWYLRREWPGIPVFDGPWSVDSFRGFAGPGGYGPQLVFPPGMSLEYWLANIASEDVRRRFRQMMVATRAESPGGERIVDEALAAAEEGAERAKRWARESADQAAMLWWANFWAGDWLVGPLEFAHGFADSFLFDLFPDRQYVTSAGGVGRVGGLLAGVLKAIGFKAARYVFWSGRGMDVAAIATRGVTSANSALLRVSWAMKEWGWVSSSNKAFRGAMTFGSQMLAFEAGVHARLFGATPTALVTLAKYAERMGPNASTFFAVELKVLQRMGVQVRVRVY